MARTTLTFALLREGTSDDALVPHLRELLVRAGAPEALGAPRDYKGTVLKKLESVLAEEAAVDVVFVHRDADGPSEAERVSEIDSAVARLAHPVPRTVAVIPIQELEAWLLLDEAAIRSVVGKPSGRAALGLPAVGSIEGTTSPKEVLRQACLNASEATGRRLKEERRKFSNRRRVLLERLDIDGPIQDLSSWRALERRVHQAVVSWSADPETPTADVS